ncbi:hypothetical protein [Mycobacterium nebraskense]|uniref:hypothetical protein n=1 Tax=Mycobacterium nebraskense TaxID=244292 RepID=UPI0018CCF631|nr:hypothetical protein [Mycobacterium nebraskense]
MTVAVWAVVTASPAAADPEPAPPFVPGTVVYCNGQAVPLDPRVSVQNPFGTLMYEAFLNAMCGPPAR